jgi:hypothetical protein
LHRFRFFIQLLDFGNLMISCFFGDRRFAYPFFIGALLKCQFGETSKTPYDLLQLL